MADLTPQTIDQAAGTIPTAASAGASGDTYSNNERTFLRFINSDTGTHTATIAVEKSSTRVPTFGDIPIAAIVVPIPPTGSVGARYAVAPRGSHGSKPSITYSSDTPISVEVMRLPRGL